MLIVAHGTACVRWEAACGLTAFGRPSLTGAIMSVAIQQTGQLALVSNRLAALGARPHSVAFELAANSRRSRYRPTETATALTKFPRCNGPNRVTEIGDLLGDGKQNEFECQQLTLSGMPKSLLSG